MSKGAITGGGADGQYTVAIDRDDGSTVYDAAWCADHTEDLSGTVGIIEIAGDRDKGINIQPGYDGNAAYDDDRDGELVVVGQRPAKEGRQAGTYWNWAMRPGWQKWRPNYRYGTITAIDKDNDQCDVTLDECVSTDTPDGNELNINQTASLSDVDIEYMDCHAEAFDVDDEVLVQFSDNDWSKPKVIGFVKEPKACGYPWIVISTIVKDAGGSNHHFYTVWDAPNSQVGDIQWEGTPISLPHEIPWGSKAGDPLWQWLQNRPGTSVLESALTYHSWPERYTPLAYPQTSQPIPGFFGSDYGFNITATWSDPTTASAQTNDAAYYDGGSWYRPFVACSWGIKRAGEVEYVLIPIPHCVRCYSRTTYGDSEIVKQQMYTPLGAMTDRTIVDRVGWVGDTVLWLPDTLSAGDLAQCKRTAGDNGNVLIQVYFYSYVPIWWDGGNNYTTDNDTVLEVFAAVEYDGDGDIASHDPLLMTRHNDVETAITDLMTSALLISQAYPLSWNTYGWSDEQYRALENKARVIRNLTIEQYR